MPRRTCTYAAVYNAAYGSGHRKVDEWVRRKLGRHRDLKHRLDFARHLLKVSRSSPISRWLHADTRWQVEREARLAHLTAAMRLRSLQRRLVRHLWRPGGRLCQREGAKAMACLLLPP